MFAIPGTYVLEKSDWVSDALDPESSEHTNLDDVNEGPEAGDDPTDTPMAPGQSSLLPATQFEVAADVIELDADTLEILGEDPSNSDKHGKNILRELATRLQHIATEGLNKYR
ncbi:hypothetical protein O0L34_g17438 [Tuta absoluta]|nr:hypothetical protein O0L34_g17438 [Tuta absoluta]